MFITIPIFSLERQEKGGRHDGHEQVGCGQDVRRNRERNWGVRKFESFKVTKLQLSLRP